MTINKIAYLAGWNTPDSLMQTWLKPLAKKLSVDLVCLEYPGYNGNAGSPASWNVENLLLSWQSKIDKNTLIIGWSLGGMLATRLASESSCAGLITLATNVSFQGPHDWQMAGPVFRTFLKQFQRNRERTTQNFRALQAEGGSSPAKTIELLQQHYDAFEFAPDCLLESLRLLGDLDLSDDKISCKSLHIFAGSDSLIPLSAAKKWQSVFPATEVIIQSGSHVLPGLEETHSNIVQWVSRRSGNN